MQTDKATFIGSLQQSGISNISKILKIFEIMILTHDIYTVLLVIKKRIVKDIEALLKTKPTVV